MRSLLLPCLAVLCAGCAPPPLYHKSGAPIAQLQADESDCIVHAYDTVPVRMRTRYIPPIYSHRSVCDRYGHCHFVGVLLSPGRVVTEDINEGKRAAAVRACMAHKGYARVSLPACETTPPSIPNRQPALTSQSCALRTQGGDWWIVTPGN